MTLDADWLGDENEIRTLVARVAYLLDSRSYDRLGEVFAQDVVFANPGRLEASGLAALIAAFSAIADPAVSHYATNVIVDRVDADTAVSTCKALALRSQGTLSAAEYRDDVIRTASGWRIARRSIRPLG